MIGAVLESSSTICAIECERDSVATLPCLCFLKGESFMLIRTEGRSNPFAEISGIAGTWFFWGTIFGICVLATAQRVINAVNDAADSEYGADSVPPPAALPSGTPNPPNSAGSSGL